MDDLTGKLGALLSDPEAMKDLTELAAMLREPDAAPDEGTAGAPSPAPETADLPPLDMGRLLAVGQLLGQQPQDANTALIAALKPHLSPERAARAEKALKLLRLYQIIGVLRESGMLNSLLS